MKNRLQIRYHIPESLPTRAQAMSYLSEAFSVGPANVDNNMSLPGEPLVILYNDNVATLTPAQALATSNAILAIGRGGDGKSLYKNQEYFVIDFAKHDEEIAILNDEVAGINEYIAEAKKTIKDIQAHVATNSGNIQSIFTMIGEKGDSPVKETVYGYVEGAYSAVRDESVRASQSELNLEHAINTEATRATAAENQLQTNIDAVINDIETERDRAMAAEEFNRETVAAEVQNRIEADGVLDNRIDVLLNSLNLEVSDRTYADTTLDGKISANADAIANNKVKSDRGTLIVSSPTRNGTNVEVNVDNNTIVVNEGGAIAVSTDALIQYKGENAIHVSDVVGGAKTISLQVNKNDKILTNDADGLLASLSLKWSHAEADGETDEIQLLGKDNVVISRIDVADFIKDGMLDNIKFDTTDADNPKLIFTFNTSSGKETLVINVKELVDVYVAGNGIDITNNVISVKLDENCEAFLTVGSDGIKLNGVQNAINATVEAEKARAEVVENNLTSKVNKNTSDIELLRGNISVDGSIKDIVFDSAVGGVVNTITVNDAASQTLLKKFTIEGTPFFYASNSTADMLHNRYPLNDTINTLRNDVNAVSATTVTLVNDVKNLTTQVDKNSKDIATLDVTVNLHKEEIASLKAKDNELTLLVQSMQQMITTLQGELSRTNSNLLTLQNEFQAFKSTAVTTINGTDKEIKVTKDGNTATVGFADDAYFIAGNK